MERFVLLLISVGIGLAIAYFLGRKRQIGFGWSFFFSIFLGPIVGFIVTMLSRKYYAENPAPSKSKKIWGWVLLIFFSLAVLLGVIGELSQVDNETRDENSLTVIFMAIGFIGLGYYLIELGKGKSFNTNALTETGK